MCLELGHPSIANNINKQQFEENAETPVAADSYLQLQTADLLSECTGCLFTVKSSFISHDTQCKLLVISQPAWVH